MREVCPLRFFTRKLVKLVIDKQACWFFRIFWIFDIFLLSKHENWQPCYIWKNRSLFRLHIHSSSTTRDWGVFFKTHVYLLSTEGFNEKFSIKLNVTTMRSWFHEQVKFLQFFSLYTCQVMSLQILLTGLECHWLHFLT